MDFVDYFYCIYFGSLLLIVYNLSVIIHLLQAQRLALAVAQSFSIAYEISNSKKDEGFVRKAFEEATSSGVNQENKYYR